MNDYLVGVVKLKDCVNLKCVCVGGGGEGK